MKIISDKNLLINAISTVQKSISTKSTMAVLEGIYMQAYENKLKLIGNNLEICIEYEIPINIEKEGTIVVNSKIFGDIIRKLPDEPITIECIEEKEILIDCGNSHFKINVINPKGYPKPPNVEGIVEYEIKQKNLKEMIRQTIFAISDDEKNKILTGSLFECKDNILSIVSIDGFRMAIRKHELGNTNNEFSMIIPGKTLNEIMKILSTSDDTIKIYSTESQIVFQTSNCKITSRLLSGEYLNYKNFLPDDYKTTIKLKKEEFLSSIERASIIATEEKKYPITISINCDGVVIKSNTEFGTVKEELYPEIDGDELVISFNPKYLMDSLKVIDDEYVYLKMTSTVGPSIISPIDGNEYSYMVLPVRT